MRGDCGAHGACASATGACACAAGYSGGRCEANIDECASAPCLHGGACADGADSFSCSCAASYSGDLCEVPTADYYCDGSGGLTQAERRWSDPSCQGSCSGPNNHNGCSAAQVAAAMAALPAGRDVQYHGCYALGELAEYGGASAAAAIVAAGSAERMTAAMARFPDDGYVQRYGCWALGGLAVYGGATAAAAIVAAAAPR